MKDLPNAHTTGFVFSKMPNNRQAVVNNSGKELKRINLLSEPFAFEEIASYFSCHNEELINCKLDQMLRQQENLKKLHKNSRNKSSFYFNLKNFKLSFANNGLAMNSQSGFINFLKTQAEKISNFKKKERVRVNSMSNVELLSEIITNQEKFDIKKNLRNRKSYDIDVQNKITSNLPKKKSILHLISKPIKKNNFSPTIKKIKKSKFSDNFDNFPVTKEMMKEEQKEKIIEEKKKMIANLQKVDNFILVKDDIFDLEKRNGSSSFVTPFYRKKKKNIIVDLNKTKPMKDFSKSGSYFMKRSAQKIDSECERHFRISQQELKKNRNLIEKDNTEAGDVVEKLKLGKHYGIIKELRTSTAEEAKGIGMFVYGKKNQGYRYSNEDRLFSSVYTMGFTSKTK